MYCPYLDPATGSVPDLSKTGLDVLEDVGCECVCGSEFSVLQPVCTNRMRDAGLRGR